MAIRTRRDADSLGLAAAAAAIGAEGRCGGLLSPHIPENMCAVESASWDVDLPSAGDAGAQ